MKLDEAIQKAREKLQNPAAKAAVQGEMHYLGVLTEVEINRQANPGNAANGDRASEGKAVVAFRLYVSAVLDRTKATPEEAFEAAKVIVFEAFQGQRENKAGFANCLREILDRKVEATGGNAPGATGNQLPKPTLTPKPAPAAPVPTPAPMPTPTPIDMTTTWPSAQVCQLIASYEGGSQDSAADEEWLRQIEGKGKGALQQFQLQSKLLTKVLTPNAALLKFQGSANLTVERVLKRRSEFLTTHGLNVISVRAEPGVVAIAIARPNRRVLHLPDVWKKWKPDCTHGNHDLLIAVKEEDSSPLFLSPKSNAPHTLIAGSTGSGKSVLMQNIILGIACTNTTAQAKIVLIDPKLGVDYFAFEGLPHLQGGIIDQQDTAILTLNELVGEMNRRYSVLKENKVSNIFDLNKKLNATEQLPFLWVIHDEFAEWMMTEEYANAVSDIVGRLGVKARAAGISLVFAAQRPDANVMPMQLRANLGNRLVLRVDGEGTSEIALGEKGAERLLGKGHLAAKLEGAVEIMFGQVPYVDSDFLAQVVTALKEQSPTGSNTTTIAPG